MKQPPCDRDCFNCKFPDCIYDGLEYADYVEQAERDKALTETPQKRKLAAPTRTSLLRSSELLRSGIKNRPEPDFYKYDPKRG